MALGLPLRLLQLNFQPITPYQGLTHVGGAEFPYEQN
jgi:hypothetical protein